MTTKTTCRSTTHHGTYWAYDKYGCRCLNAAVDASRIRRLRRNGPTGLIRPAIGAVRTARGLAAYGCTVKQIAEAASLSDRLIAHLQAGKDNIRASKDRQLRVTAERLIASPPPTGMGATRARRTAQRNGWFPLLAWDDIDDPNAQPNLGDRDPSLIDEVAVHRALNGERIRLTPAEREHAFRIGLAEGMSANGIGLRLGMNGGYVREIAARIRATQAA